MKPETVEKLKEAAEKLMEAAGCVGEAILYAVLAFLWWLFLVATPPQNSAECDYWAAKLEGGAK